MRNTDKIAIFMLLCLTLASCKPGSEEGTGEAEEPADAAPVEAAPAQPQGFSKMGWKIVDRNKAMAENPNLIEVINDTNASDPISAIMQARYSAISKLNTIIPQYDARLQSNINAADGGGDPKPPTFEEFNATAKLNSNNVKGLYPWQAYAYDETTGKVTILEDPDEKKRIHEERKR